MADSAPIIYPTIRYDDAPAAIRFLTTAFGFVAQEVDRGEDGRINHSLLRYGPSLVMLSSRGPGSSPFDHGTVCLYVAVDDPDAHHARAVAAGADALKPPQDTFWGGYAGYFADPDGHLWEVAWNPFFPLDERGNLLLPDSVR